MDAITRTAESLLKWAGDSSPGTASGDTQPTAAGDRHRPAAVTGPVRGLRGGVTGGEAHGRQAAVPADGDAEPVPVAAAVPRSHVPVARDLLRPGPGPARALPAEPRPVGPGAHARHRLPPPRR